MYIYIHTHTHTHIYIYIYICMYIINRYTSFGCYKLFKFPTQIIT